ncbi:MAG: glycoside hydrolase N-terminal domain-containing protein [Candidatus Latescibacterota bacterium]
MYESGEFGRHRLVMRQPATRWQDALPTGNGAIGAMLYGQIRSEVILLNHEALYRPRHRGPLLDISDLLPELRSLIDEGRYGEARALPPRAHAERGGAAEGSTSNYTDPYQPLGDLRLHGPTAGAFRAYRRGIDLDTGRVWARWEDQGCEVCREVFVSRASDTVWVRMRGSLPGRITQRLRLAPHDPDVDQGPGWSTQRQLEPAVFAASVEGPAAGSTAGTTVVATVPRQGWLTLTGRFPGAWAYGAVARVSTRGGLVRVEGEEVACQDADEFVVQVRLFVREDPEVAVARLRVELAQERPDFDAAFAAHAAVHRELFARTALDLPAGEPASIEELLLQAYDGEAPTPLVQALFEYGRYLLICSSRPGGWPANLQGIWNGDHAPAWNADIHTDENVQMNYWQALPGNLPEVCLPCFDYFERFLEDYRDNARKLYGCGGILVPIAQTTHGVAFPTVWANWISAAGWLGQLFYDYYLHTGDRRFLRERALPWLHQVAAFYEDFLQDGPDGRLRFSPSLSPENTPAGEGMDLVTVNATMDVAVCREVLAHLCQGCRVLGIEAEGVARWEGMLTRLPEYQVNPDGALCEWLHPRFQDNYHHRHLSHLYPLFPGFEITEETHPALFAACRTAIEKRLVIGLASQTGWSMAHMACLYARLGEGNRALACIDILARSSLGPNLFTYHNDWRDMGLSLSGWGRVPPFQIDANLGTAAAVLEMLVFSRPGFIKLLPAVPDRWECGCLRGASCRGGIRLDLEWDLPARHLAATLISRETQEVVVRLPRGAEITPLPGASPLEPSGLAPDCWRVSLAGGREVQVEAVMVEGRRGQAT